MARAKPVVLYGSFRPKFAGGGYGYGGVGCCSATLMWMKKGMLTGDAYVRKGVFERLPLE